MVSISTSILLVHHRETRERCVGWRLCYFLLDVTVISAKAKTGKRGDRGRHHQLSLRPLEGVPIGKYEDCARAKFMNGRLHCGIAIDGEIQKEIEGAATHR